jgi:hypothetical protein
MTFFMCAPRILESGEGPNSNVDLQKFFDEVHHPAAMWGENQKPLLYEFTSLDG